jgi:glycosyltransferase involved in cell wall biosynthesis
MKVSRLARRLAITLVRANLALRDLMQGLVLLALLRLRGKFFSAEYYAANHLGGRAPRFPRLHYAFVGARQLADPNPWFSQTRWLGDHPRIAGRGYLPVLFYLLFDPVARGVVRDVPPAGPDSPDVSDRFRVLWPAIQRDMAEIRDHERFLSGAPALGETLSARRRHAGPAIIGRPLQRALDALPHRIDHLLVVPWIGIAGGSERITQRLIRVLGEHYGPERLAIVGPDYSFDRVLDGSVTQGVPTLGFNSVIAGEPAGLSVDHRIDLLDRLLVHHRPRTLHCINSWIGWRSLQERATYYRQDSKIFGNVYSDVRFQGGIPGGAFWDFMPDCFDSMTGIFADNYTVVRKAREYFAYTPKEMERFHVVFTPILGLDTGAAGLRPFGHCPEPHSLWMSRIAVEKRIELVGEIARAMPARHFSVYGAVIEGALPVDMTGLLAQPNVTIHGEYGALTDLPFDRFDSYVFTTTAEGLPIALLEASQFGLPTVAPDIGGIGEFIDARTGWLVPADSPVEAYVAALEEIRRDPAEAARRVTVAQRRLVERHSWEAFRAGIHGIPGYLNGPGRAAMQPGLRERAHA